MIWRALVWTWLPRQVLEYYADRTILRQPDRIFIAQVLIPKIVARRPKRVLALGVHYYTQRMQRTIERSGIELFTADPDARKVRWGAKSRHRVCTAAEIKSHFPGATFDVVLLNGVLGYGLDTQEELDRTYRAVAAKMEPGGLLVLGWDDNMFHDPLASGAHMAYFVEDEGLLGKSRMGRLSGLRHEDGRPATKYFDVLRRS